MKKLLLVICLIINGCGGGNKTFEQTIDLIEKFRQISKNHEIKWKWSGEIKSRQYHRYHGYYRHGCNNFMEYNKTNSETLDTFNKMTNLSVADMRDLVHIVCSAVKFNQSLAVMPADHLDIVFHMLNSVISMLESYGYEIDLKIYNSAFNKYVCNYKTSHEEE